MKDNTDQEGRANTCGVVALKGDVAGEDAALVAALRAAGAVLAGRSNLSAFSLRWFGENELHDRTFNCGPGTAHRDVRLAYSRLQGPIHGYVPVLVEHAARERLREVAAEMPLNELPKGHPSRITFNAPK